MVSDPITGQLKPFDFDRLLQQVPELSRFPIRIDTHALPKPVDSSDIGPNHWIELVDLIERNYQRYDGFVILHGTDTMSYTASALSFLLENLAKPVILTGSQLPLGIIRTDGKENLITSIEIAAEKDAGQPVVSEVAIYFEYKLYRGNRTHKYNAEHFDAFHSPNYPILAEAGVQIGYNRSAMLGSRVGPFRAHRKLSTDVAVLKLFPGITETFVKSVLSTTGLKGLVLETFGSGNAPSLTWFNDLLQEKIEMGLVVVNVTQCAAGRVEMGRYSASHGLQTAGVIGGADVTTEAAITKLMFLLAKEDSTDEIKRQFLLPLAGELS